MSGTIHRGDRPAADEDAALERLARLKPLRRLGELAARHGDGVWVVGGAVRDAFLGRPIADLDIVIGGDFEAFLESASAAFERRVHDLGDVWQSTHRMHWRGFQVDLARLQGELSDDLGRRDFTVNAMAVRLPLEGQDGAGRGGAVVDLAGGREDLLRRTLRCVSTAVLEADPLRLVRGPRYVAVLPGFEIEQATAAAIAERHELLGRVAAERIQAEWEILLGGERWATGVRRAYELGVGSGSLGSVEGLEGVDAWSAAEADARPAAADADPLPGRLAALLWCRRPAAVEPLAADLLERRWPRRLARAAARAAVWAGDVDRFDEKDRGDEPTDDRMQDPVEEQMVEWVSADRIGAALAAALRRALAAWRGESVPAAAERMATLARRAAEEPWVSGEDLLGWGMDEGRNLGDVLREARRGQLLRRWATRQQARDEVRGWARRGAAEPVENGPAGDDAPEDAGGPG